MAGRKAAPKRRAAEPAAASPVADAPPPRGAGKRRKGGDARPPSQESREARFVAKLAAVLQQQSPAGGVEAGAVREALKAAVAGLPEGKPLKQALQRDIDSHAAALCRHLGATDAPPKEAKAEAEAKPAAPFSSRFELLLQPRREEWLAKLEKLSLPERQQLLLAHAPAPLPLLCSCLPGASPLELLGSAVALWSSLTPLDGGDGGASHWEEVAALAGDALRAAAGDEGDMAQLSGLLSRLMAAQAVRRRRCRYADADADGVAGGGGGDVLLVRAQVSAWEAARGRRSAPLAADVARDLRALGLPAWHRLALYRGVAAAHTHAAAPGSAAPTLGTYLKALLLHKRAMGRASARAGAKSGADVMRQLGRLLPPPDTAAWLVRQPQNRAVTAAASALERQPEDLTAHLLVRAPEKEVQTLLQLWQADPTDPTTAAPQAAAPAAPQVDEEQAEPAADADILGDSLFFVDKAGSAFESQFGRDWGDGEGVGEGADGSGQDDSDDDDDSLSGLADGAPDEDGSGDDSDDSD
eukprot:jgi/Tetstr1/430771/TSEL_020556.t1